MATPRSKLRRNHDIIDNIPHKKYKDIEVKDYSNFGWKEELESDSDINITEDEEGDDETDRCNLYPDLHILSNSDPKFISPRSKDMDSKYSPRLKDLDSKFRISKPKEPDYSLSGKKYKNSENIPANMKQKIYPKLPNEINESHYKFSAKNVFIFIIIFILFVSSIFVSFSKKKEKEIRSLEEIYQVIKPDLISLKQKYPQTKQLWTQILSQIRHITSEDPLQPSLLFVVVSDGAESSANCFIKKFCESVSNGFQDDEIITFDASRHSHLDPDDFRFELDNSLRGLNSIHCAVIQNIQDAVSKSIMILHGYCDNENAIFKRAFIIFTMRSNEKYEDMSLPQIFKLIETKLMEVWREELRIDDIAALISRVATSPVIFKPGGPVC